MPNTNNNDGPPQVTNGFDSVRSDVGSSRFDILHNKPSDGNEPEDIDAIKRRLAYLEEQNALLKSQNTNLAREKDAALERLRNIDKLTSQQPYFTSPSPMEVESVATVTATIFPLVPTPHLSGEDIEKRIAFSGWETGEHASDLKDISECSSGIISSIANTPKILDTFDKGYQKLQYDPNKHRLSIEKSADGFERYFKVDAQLAGERVASFYVAGAQYCDSLHIPVDDNNKSYQKSNQYIDAIEQLGGKEKQAIYERFYINIKTMTDCCFLMAICDTEIKLNTDLSDKKDQITGYLDSIINNTEYGEGKSEELQQISDSFIDFMSRNIKSRAGFYYIENDIEYLVDFRDCLIDKSTKDMASHFLYMTPLERKDQLYEKLNPYFFQYSVPQTQIHGSAAVAREQQSLALGQSHCIEGLQQIESPWDTPRTYDIQQQTQLDGSLSSPRSLSSGSSSTPAPTARTDSNDQTPSTPSVLPSVERAPPSPSPGETYASTRGLENKR